MENGIEKLFAEIKNRESKTIKSSALNTGSIPFNFQLDTNGNYSYATSKHGFGKTLQCTAEINSPSGSYNIIITSTDGGGGSWTNVSINQPLSFQIQTKGGLESTTITVTIHSTATNQVGTGMINYSY